MTTLNDITEFLAPKKLAIAGASRNPKKFGGIVFAELKKRGFELFPVNPNAQDIQGVTCVKSVADLPDNVENLFVATPKNETSSVVQQAIDKGIKRIWIQLSADTPEAVELAQKNQVSIIYGKCIFMFAEPVSGVHSFHRWLSKLFGGYPKPIGVANHQ